MSTISAANSFVPPPLRRKLKGGVLRLSILIPFGALLLLTLAAAAEPLLRHLAGYADEGVDLMGRFAPPSIHHWLGQDELGRDLLLRLLEGGRVSLLVGFAGAALATLIGAAIGIAAGARRGWLDALLMRVTDGVMTLPLLPLLIVLAAIDLTKLGFTTDFAQSQAANVIRIILIVALVGWTGTARLTRSAALSVMSRDYVRAAEAMGATLPRLVRRHLLPNIMGVILVAASFAVGHTIMLESALSFIGVGIQPPTPSWGNMLTNAQESIFEAPALALYPGLLIFITVVACNFLADALQRRR